MEGWVALFNIFMNSLTPESDASLWFQQCFNPSSSPSLSPSSFFSLLSKPTTLYASSHHYHPPRVMWIETLPSMVQARILSFLAYEHRRFDSRDLSQLARNVLNGKNGVDFWVKRAAQNLLDKSSQSNLAGNCRSNVNSVSTLIENEFYSVPNWLNDANNDCEINLVLPWLPVSLDELNLVTKFENNVDDTGSMTDVESEDEREDEVEPILNKSQPDNASPISTLDLETRSRAASLNARILKLDKSSEAIELAEEILQICHQTRAKSNPIEVLALIEAWKLDDEAIVILSSHLLGIDEYENRAWPSQVLSSTILPKLLVLDEPASRILLSATTEYCKLHQRDAEYALLLPLIHRKEGINNPLCDVISKILKDSLHPAHTAAFCQKILSGGYSFDRLMCLHCHRSLISPEPVWTEPFFSLFHNILNHNVKLSQDSVDNLVVKIHGSAGKFSKSLKFGNFLLCFVAKCSGSLKSYKVLLIEAVNQTNTIVTKPILSKLSSL